MDKVLVQHPSSRLEEREIAGQLSQMAKRRMETKAGSDN